MAYTPSVRKVREVLDPATLQMSDVNASMRQSGTEFQQQYTQDTLQRRFEEQQAKEQAANEKRLRQLQQAQRRASMTTAKRNEDYAARLQSQIDMLTGKWKGGLDPDAYSAEGHTKAYQKALNWANQQVTNPTRDWTRMCQSFARTAVHASAFGTTALKAWQSTPIEAKRFTYPPRPGSIAYYVNPKNPGAGHAVFVGDNGKVYSNDIKRTGKIDIVNWNVFQKKWGMQYLGYIVATPSGRLPVQGG